MSSRTAHVRRVALAGVAALAAVTMTPITSHAATTSTVTVVGTSDVFDSDLIQNVIAPDFEAAYPQYTLNYVSQGTGAAISYAEAGTASALLVHAASLENQFVASGFSDEQYGRAIFYGDYVLLGPASDPAGVKANAPHDIVKAFQDIADYAASTGKSGTPNVNFVSRGGTPGTTVAEHQIWAQLPADPNLTLCPVSAANGGGEVPADPTETSCANPNTSPSWYHTTGLTQGPNVVNADVCNYPNANCYVFTDRGTYQYLLSTGAISNLSVDTNYSATGAADSNLLINSFHAYAINPNAPAFAGNSNVHINLPGATAFLNWLTSPAGQKDVTAYQANDPGGSSFIGDAYPALSASAATKTVAAGHQVTISGTLSNVVPGTPPLAGVAVKLMATTAGSSTATAVASGTTDASGKYSLSYTPTATATYTVDSAAISQIEDTYPSPPNPPNTPPFGDLLQATSSAPVAVTVTGAAKISSISAKRGDVTIKGTLAPAVAGSNAHLSIYADHASVPATRALKYVTMRALAKGKKTFTVHVTLKRHVRWRVSVRYVNAGVTTAGNSSTRTVHVT